MPYARPPVGTRTRPSRDTALHRKTSPAAKRTGGYRRVATRKVTGGYPAPKGTDKRVRAEWNNSVTLRPPVVCTGRGGGSFTHGLGTACTPWILVGLHAPRWAPPRWLPASPATRKHVCVAEKYVWLRVSGEPREGPEVRERCRVAQTRVEWLRGFRWFPNGSRDRSIAVRLLRRGADFGQLPAFGLYMSLHHPVSLGCWGVLACTRVRPTVLHDHQKFKFGVFPY